MPLGYPGMRAARGTRQQMKVRRGALARQIQTRIWSLVRQRISYLRGKAHREDKLDEVEVSLCDSRDIMLVGQRRLLGPDRYMVLPYYS